MKRKSKFIGLILSIIPGLTHLYFGIMDRALIFFATFFIGMGGIIGFSDYIGGGGGLAAIFYPILWLIALIDAYSYRENSYINEDGQIVYTVDEEGRSIINNKKTLTMLFSIVPGAGHMYLGYEKKGLLLMGTFFLSIFLMGWLGISLLLFLLPMLWFYSFFDALHIVEGKKDGEDIEVDMDFIKGKEKYIGIGLIAVGLIGISNKTLYILIGKYMSPKIISLIQTSIVGIIFIVGGIYILEKQREDKD